VRSLFAKILLWFLATTVITIGAVAVSSAITSASERQQPPPFAMMRVQSREARWAYETGGKSGLAAALQRFKQVTGGDFILADHNGRDLLTGEDRSGLVKEAEEMRRLPFPFPFTLRNRLVFARPSPDQKYWYFTIVPNRRGFFWFIQPHHLWILGMVVLLCYALAFYLTSPVRALQRAVDRFGKGDLTARAPARRKDELGELAQTFNRMADRIQTLVTAERRLLMDISHELRSPLARLGVAIELARGREARPELDRIQKEAERLNELVDELIEVTRAEGDPAHRRTEKIQLDEILVETVEDCRIEADAHGCTLTLDAGAPVMIQGDPELLRRAVENVIRNAIRYAPRDSSVDVTAKRIDGTARILIRDYGPGVPEDALPLLFEAFYRVDSDRNRKSGGVGLGLSIARRAVEIHRGKISAANAHPGLLVEIDLPVAPEDGARGESERALSRQA
jgi:two-component system sensor histidine kinase CpxA